MQFWSCVLVFSAIVLVSCNRAMSSEAEAVEVLKTNLQANEEEDWGKVEQTLHPGMAGKAETQVMSLALFKTYDLDYEIESSEILYNDSSQIIVRTVQTTKKISGPDFKNNRITMKHELRKDGDSWKIYNSMVENIEYLN